MGSEESFSDDYNFTIRVTVLVIVCIVSLATVVFFVVCMIKFAPCCQSYLGRRNINLPFHRQSTYDPCVMCQLIEMGEMACYTGVCSRCGKVPPSVARATISTEETKQI